MALFKRKTVAITDNRPIVWEVYSGSWAPMAAGAELTATPYGNVCRNVGYIVRLSALDLKTMDFDPRMYAQTLIEMSFHPYFRERLRLNYTEDTLWVNGYCKPFIASGDFYRIFHPEG